jgi:hypothetical protein
MANAATTTPTTTTQYPTTAFSLVVMAAGWLVPGAGHLIQKKWIRGILLMAAILTMFLMGLGMQGKVYAFNTGDLLDILGFFGDIGAGGLYLLTRINDWGQGAIFRATADYGTKYIIVAGLLNVVAAIDAYHIAIGKKK